MYLDTAILVKLFLREPDSDFYAGLVDNAVVVSSSIAYAEVWSAVLSKERSGMITRQQRNYILGEFSRSVDEDIIQLIPLSLVVLKKANRILEDCHPDIPLRSLDALHLASCDHLQEWPLITNDKRMRRAAAHLRFPLGEVAS